MKTKIPIIALILLSISGCFGETYPTEEFGKTAFEKYFQSRVKTSVEINEFKKINGVPGEINGNKIYEMQFQIGINFPDGIKPIKTGMFSIVNVLNELKRALRLKLVYKQAGKQTNCPSSHGLGHFSG